MEESESEIEEEGCLINMDSDEDKESFDGYESSIDIEELEKLEKMEDKKYRQYIEKESLKIIE